MKKKKIALAHDYLREYGGAERVLEALHNIYPAAPVYTAFYDAKAMGDNWQRFANWDLRQTWMAKIPLIKKLFSPLRFLADNAFADLDLSDYDYVISSSNAYFAKAVKVPNGKHFCYCHTPPRVLYGYSAKSNWKANPFTRFAGNLLNHFVRQTDFKVSQKVDQFIANSKETQGRIKKFYKMDSIIINPPVKICDQADLFFKDLKKAELKEFSEKKKNSYYLYVNRLALAKHPEMAIQVATDMGLNLKVVGTGDMLPKLKEMAGPSIEFMGGVDDEALNDLYKNAKALLYPVEDEDFGMVPIESMAWGTPVIAHRSGGPKETITEGKTGVFFDQLSVESLKTAIKKFEKSSFDSAKIHLEAMKYSLAVFEKKIKKLISD